MLYWLQSLLIFFILLFLWAACQGADVTLVWDTPPQGAVSSRVYQTRAGECVLNAAQYTALEPDIQAPASQATLPVEAGQGYCWLVRYVDGQGLVGNASYVIGYRVPPQALPPPQQLRVPGQEGAGAR